jgi:hypothetical protein
MPTVWTTGSGLPLGKLLSFGSSTTSPSAGDRLVFSGSGAVSADADNTAPQVLVAGQDAMEILTGQQFAIDKTGFAAMPYKESVVQWTYFLAATGATDAALWADVEYRLHQMWAWYWGTYTYSNASGSVTYSGASGQKGDLLVADAATGAARTARAVWLSFPFKPVPGQVGYYEVELTFRLLTSFS